MLSYQQHRFVCICSCFLLYFCIRQHDVNILMLWVSWVVRDDCVLRFFLSNLQKLLLVSLQQNYCKRSEISNHFLVLFCCYGTCFCIRQHDVNIWRPEFLKLWEMIVCSVFFFLNFKLVYRPKQTVKQSLEPFLQNSVVFLLRFVWAIFA